MNAQNDRGVMDIRTEMPLHRRWFDWSVLALILGIKVLVLIFGGVVYTVWANKAPVGFYGWLEIWNRWDGPHYLDIARDGYLTQGDQRNWIVFYPLYPWAIRLFTLIFRNGLLSAFVVSALASVVAGLLLSRLTKLDFERAVPRSAVWFMFIFPTSYFFHIGYTESLFLAFALGSFLAARRRAWWLAGVVGALACLTRVNGLVLIPALACEAFLQYRTDGRRGLRAEWLWIAFIGSGFAFYLLVNYHVFGNPLAFLQFQHDWFFKLPAWPWVGILKVWTWKWGNARQLHINGTQEFFFILLSLACTIWCWRSLRGSYTVWMALNWLLFTSTSWVQSVPRYVLGMFPIFILFARSTATRPVWFGLITVWSLMFMSLFITLLVQGEWAF
jgi:Predicted integral membrane protein